ncbi:hypothetical protein ABBQ32_008761 [Trebouxia sp. C0010 RCD-2024]
MLSGLASHKDRTALGVVVAGQEKRCASDPAGFTMAKQCHVKKAAMLPFSAGAPIGHGTMFDALSGGTLLDDDWNADGNVAPAGSSNIPSTIAQTEVAGDLVQCPELRRATKDVVAVRHARKRATGDATASGSHEDELQVTRKRKGSQAAHTSPADKSDQQSADADHIDLCTQPEGLPGGNELIVDDTRMDNTRMDEAGTSDEDQAAADATDSTGTLYDCMEDSIFPVVREMLDEAQGLEPECEDYFLFCDMKANYWIDTAPCSVDTLSAWNKKLLKRMGNEPRGYSAHRTGFVSRACILAVIRQNALQLPEAALTAILRAGGWQAVTGIPTVLRVYARKVLDQYIDMKSLSLEHDLGLECFKDTVLDYNVEKHIFLCKDDWETNFAAAFKHIGQLKVRVKFGQAASKVAQGMAYQLP